MKHLHIGPAAHICRGVMALAVTAAALPAKALDCPEPPKQQQKDWDTTVSAEVGRIGPVRGAELQTRVASAPRDLLTKLPNADLLYLEQMMFASYCSALRDDRTLDESAKARQVLDYRRELKKSLRP